MASKPKIVVVGSSNTDMIIKADRIPAPGETIVGGTFATAPGGKGANQAVAAARAGGDVTFVARVGDDMLGAQAVDGYAKEGIDVSLIQRDPKLATGVALIMVDATGDNSISVASGANFALTPADVERAADAIKSAKMVVCQLETPLETIQRAAELARESGVPVLLDPAPAPSEPLPNSLLERVSIIKPNETEASRLTGIEVVDEATAKLAAEKLLALGIETVVVTLGAAGSFVATKDGARVLVPALRVDAVDATAAGDAYSGALAVALAEGKALSDAVAFATKAAALSVRKLGAQPSLPSREEIDRA
ncbi:MAG: ribokinase [Thermoguttaceae bacterium]|nr:ribokinase [Thermoguttaceae bacterium]